jgi:hypothetical protein
VKIEKRFLVELNRCYAVTGLSIAGKRTILVATEGEGSCYAFDGPEYDRRRTVWEGPGGTMSMIPIPGRDGEFLAVQKFFKLFQWDEAILVWVKPLPDGSFAARQILQLPYIHRFDLFETGGTVHFLGCTLAESKESRDDWSNPGKIYVGELGSDWDEPLRLEVLREGLFRNHGYCRSVWMGLEAGLVTSEEGAFALTPPKASGGKWKIERFMDWPISDIAGCDIDGCSEMEYATIEPWHGDLFRVYKKAGGAFKLAYEHPEKSEFYHVVTDARLRGNPTFIGGCRRGSQHLFYLRVISTEPLSLEAVTIEEGVGPSNVAIVNEPSRDLIISANREKGEAALYIVSG